MKTTDEQYRKAARAQYADDDLEFYHDATVSRTVGTDAGEGGAWVAAWVYVEALGSGEATEPEEGAGP